MASLPSTQAWLDLTAAGTLLLNEEASAWDRPETTYRGLSHWLGETIGLL